MNDTIPAPTLVRKEALAQVLGVSPRTVDMGGTVWTTLHEVH